jgi:peroxiredoxin family protein
VPSELGILLISGTYERAHYAFVIASAAAAIGRRVTLFATNQGCHAVAADWSGLSDAQADASLQGLGVAGFATLREAAIELGARLIACEAGLRVAGVAAGALAASVEVAGIVTFLQATKSAQIITL